MYSLLKTELFKHESFVNRYIVMHDTNLYAGPKQGDPIGLTGAILEFLAQHPHWGVHSIRHNNNGLTILERRNNGYQY